VVQSSSSDDAPETSRETISTSAPHEHGEPPPQCSRGGDPSPNIDADVVTYQGPPSGFVTQRGRKVRKARHRRSPWVGIPRTKRRRVDVHIEEPPQELEVVRDERASTLRAIYDPFAPVSQDDIESFGQWMRTGEPMRVNLEVLEVDKSFFQTILSTEWLDGEVCFPYFIYKPTPF
jgi:hypothetical protein